MSSSDARRSQSGSTQRSTKRLPEDTENVTPEIMISNSSSSTIILAEGNINSNLLTAAPPQNHNTYRLAIKLNRSNVKHTTHSEMFCQNVYRKTLSRRD